jgi:hypothetical protein
MSPCSSRLVSTILFGSVAALIPLLLTVAPAFAASRQAEEKAARKACLNGDYTKGVAILSDLFVETREPIYVFNQGRCLEQNLRYREAIARFEEYLRMGETMKLESADRTAAEKHIADCKARLPEDPDKTQALSPPQVVQPPPAAALPAPEPAPKPEPTAPSIAKASAQPESPKSRSTLLTAGIITGAVGVVGVVGGVILNLKANSMVNDMETKLGNYSTANVNDQKTYQTLAWVGYGVGAACVVAGAVLIGVGAKSGTSSSTAVALVPAVGPGQAGAMLTGGF